MPAWMFECGRQKKLRNGNTWIPMGWVNDKAEVYLSIQDSDLPGAQSDVGMLIKRDGTTSIRG